MALDPQKALFKSIMMKDTKAAEAFIKAGADVNSGDMKRSPLNMAIEMQTPEMVTMLMKNGANIHKIGYSDQLGQTVTPYRLCKIIGNEQVINLIEQQDALIAFQKKAAETIKQFGNNVTSLCGSLTKPHFNAEANKRKLAYAVSASPLILKPHHKLA